jgi:hypothetical protein
MSTNTVTEEVKNSEGKVIALIQRVDASAPVKKAESLIQKIQSVESSVVNAVEGEIKTLAAKIKKGKAAEEAAE